MRRELSETVQRTVPITGIVRDLVFYARYLVEEEIDVTTASDAEPVRAARDYWDREHGE